MGLDVNNFLINSCFSAKQISCLDQEAKDKFASFIALPIWGIPKSLALDYMKTKKLSVPAPRTQLRPCRTLAKGKKRSPKGRL